MKMLSVSLATLLVLAAPPALRAEDSPPAPRSVPIVSLVRSVAERTHRKVVVDPRVVADVTLVNLDAREVSYEQLLTSLAVHNFAVHSGSGLLVVEPVDSERQLPGPVVASGTVTASDAEFVTAIVPVRNLSAVQLVPVLRPLMPSSANLSGIAGSNVLVLVDRAANVRRMQAIIAALDKNVVPIPAAGARDAGQ